MRPLSRQRSGSADSDDGLCLYSGHFSLVVATGAGAMARKVMGVALLGGMTLATFLGVFFYPMLFVFIGKLCRYEKKRDMAPKPE